MADDHRHVFQCEAYEEGISKETCDCGAVKFEVSWYEETSEGKVQQRRAVELTRLYGKEGKKMAVNIKDLDAETIKKLNLEEEKRLADLPPVPTKPKSTWAKRDYYNDNRNQIVAEIQQFGELRTRKRWGISASGWIFLKRRWGLPVKAINQGHAKHPRREKLAAAPHPAWNGHSLPDFPAFDKSWPESVQLKWLETYSALRR